MLTVCRNLHTCVVIGFLELLSICYEDNIELLLASVLTFVT